MPKSWCCFYVFALNLIICSSMWKWLSNDYTRNQRFLILKYATSVLHPDLFKAGRTNVLRFPNNLPPLLSVKCPHWLNLPPSFTKNVRTRQPLTAKVFYGQPLILHSFNSVIKHSYLYVTLHGHSGQLLHNHKVFSYQHFCSFMAFRSCS